MFKPSESKLGEMAKEAAFLMSLRGQIYGKQDIAAVYKSLLGLGLLPELVDKQKKSDAKSELFRATGNQAYKKKDLTEAFRLYTKAICFAEADGKPIAMAFANRSAVNFELKAYNDSITDINHVLKTGRYPDHLKHKLFERRGKCYMALSQYQKATEDHKQIIVLLLNSDLSNQVTINQMKSTVEVIAECFGKEDVPQPQIAEPKFTHEPSKHINCASAAIDLRFSSKMGKHVVATTNITPGDILAVEAASVSILTPDFCNFYCDNCKIRCQSSIPCEECNNVVFCSNDCRQKSWASHHSIECDLLPTLMNLECTDGELVAVRAFLKATKCGKDLQRFVDEYCNEPKDTCQKTKRGKAKAPKGDGSKRVSLYDDYRSIHNMVTHEENRIPTQMHTIVAMACSLVHVLKVGSSFFDGCDVFTARCGTFNRFSPFFQLHHIAAADLMLRYLMISACNSYAFHETNITSGEDSVVGKLRDIGAALYPFYSLFNHSCDPDVHLYTHSGDIRVLYAIKPIVKGQQVFMSYGAHYAEEDLVQRHITLNSNYFFTCECPACLNSWPLLDDIPEHPTFVSERAQKTHGQKILDSLAELLPIFLAAETAPISQVQFQTLVEHLCLFHKYVKLPWGPYYLIQHAIKSYFMFKGNVYVNNDLGLDE